MLGKHSITGLGIFILVVCFLGDSVLEEALRFDEYQLLTVFENASVDVRVNYPLLSSIILIKMARMKMFERVWEQWQLVFICMGLIFLLVQNFMPVHITLLIHNVARLDRFWLD